MTSRMQLVVLSLATTLGCTGSVGKQPANVDNPKGGTGSNTGGGGGTGGPGPVDEKGCALPPARIRQLTPIQIEASLAQLFPKAGLSRLELPRPGRGGSGFTNDAERLLMSLADVEQRYATLSKVADTAAAAPGALMECLASPNEACVNSFVSDFGSKAFRRPLTNEEQGDFVAFWKQRQQVDAGSALALLLRRLLLAPQFLFRTELGTEVADGAVELTNFEKAAALAFTITDGPPDEELLADAKSGGLDSPERMAFHAERLLAKPEAAAGFFNMFDELFRVGSVVGVPKDEVFEGFSAAIAEDMANETRQFIKEVLWNDDATIQTLLTAPYSTPNGRLAMFYGLSGSSNNTTFSKQPWGKQPRAGILGQGAWLTILAHANQNDIVKRGRFVRELLLCEEIPDPPPSVNAIPPPPEGDLSLRERLVMHSKDPTCVGCHNLMDPIGYAFEAFDGVGRFRDNENGKPINAQGEIIDSKGSDGSFNGVVELGAHLAKSSQVRACFARTAFRFVFGRADGDADACQVAASDEALRESNGDLKQLFVQLLTSEQFSKRSALGGN